jgi:gluconokinase
MMSNDFDSAHQVRHYSSEGWRTQSIAPQRVVLMGVCGCGKSSLGLVLADELGWTFVEGDSEHGENNVAKMEAGLPLNDEDRADWLDRLSLRLAQAHEDGRGLIMSCSALKRSYRDRLRLGDADVLFVHLQGDEDLITKRMSARRDHYMPISLIQSQFADLQPPGTDELAMSLSIDHTIEQLAQAVLEQLRTKERVHD